MLSDRALMFCQVTSLLIFSALASDVYAAGPSAPSEFVEYARVSMRLRFLQRTWNRDVFEQDPVNTQVGEAQVSGHQSTSVSVQLAAQPGGGIAQLKLLGFGRVHSNTLGVTSQARVNSLGDHTFEVIKPIYFNGRQFLTRRAHGQVNASTQPIAISTRFSGLPFLGAIGERIAWSETYRRQPNTNAIVARQVADDVMPQFDERADSELAAANVSWSQMRQRIAKLLPTRQVDWQADSTQDSLTLRAGFRMAAGTQRVGRPVLHTAMRPNPQRREDLVVSVSDSLINDLLETLPLQGVTVSDAALQSLQDISLESIFAGESLRVPPSVQEAVSAPATLFSLQFANSTPLEVLFEQAKVAVVLRFRVLPKIGPASGMYALKLTLNGADGGQGRWAVRIGDVTVTAEDENVGSATMTQILRTQTRKLLLDQPPTIVPRLTRLQASTGLSDLQLRDIRTQDGMLRASFELADP